MYVQATNGLFYKNPVMVFSDAFCTHDTMSIRRFERTSKESALARGRKLTLGFGKLRHEGALMGKVVFPPKWDLMTEAFQFQFSVVNKIPIPEVFDSCTGTVTYDTECIGFETDFSFSMLVNTVVGKEVDGLLVRALLKKEFYRTEIEKMRPELVKKLYAQCKVLREFNKKNYVELLKAGSYPEKVSIKWRKA